jgi:ribose transport system substrate-binding protein
MPRIFLAVCVVLSLLGGCKQEDAKTGGGASKITIAVIPKGTTHRFWESVHAGAEAGAKESGVEIIWKGPVKEDDRAAQVQVVQEFIGDKVSGIVLAPLDSKALLDPVQTADGEKIPVVIMDSALDGQVGKDFVSFVATDNLKGGEIAGEELARILGNKGKVVLLRYAVGSASTDAREQGFLKAMAKHPEIKIISENQYAGSTADSAAKVALTMVDVLKQADGIFCPNESSTDGMLSALRTADLLGGKIKFVGFDATSQLVDALKAKDLDALVAQDPFKMGHDGVVTLAKSIKGEKVPERVDTGVTLITRDNLDTPTVQELLKH